MYKAVCRISVMVLSALAMSASANDFKITNSKLVFNGFGYFRGKAEDIDLASYGQKKTPVTGINYLAKQNNIDRDHLGKVSVAISGPYSIDWSSYSDTDVKASISYLTVAGGTGSFSRQAAMNAKLKLIRLSIDGEGPLKTLLNEYANGARNYLKDEGNDGRVVSAVWVAMEGTLADQVKKCGKVTGEGTNGSVRVTIDVKACSGSKSTVDLPPRTTFAYGLHKVKSWNSGKTKVDNLEDDQQGVN